MSLRQEEPMTRAWTGRLRTFVTLMVGVLTGTLATGLLTAQQAPAPAPAPAATGASFGAPLGPCGPQSQLPAEFSKNVHPTARCFEVRMYTVDKTRANTGTFGGINELHQRFREKEVSIFQKHGAEIVGVWQRLDNPDTLVWMLAYRDRSHREEVWKKFAADPEWKALASKYSVPITPQVFMMSAADYSPLK
jgi:hypothetical protein